MAPQALRTHPVTTGAEAVRKHIKTVQQDKRKPTKTYFDPQDPAPPRHSKATTCFYGGLSPGHLPGLDSQAISFRIPAANVLKPLPLRPGGPALREARGEPASFHRSSQLATTAG